jgi:C-methyltransferase C-terminal domain
VCHDRRSYFSCTSLDALVRRHGLFLNDVELHPERTVDRLRCRVEPGEAITDRCEALLSAEQERGAEDVTCYEGFDRDVRTVLRDLNALLSTLRAHGHSIAALGADADIVTVLNAAGVGPDLVDFVVEPDALMQGMHIPGVRVPIVSPDVLRRECCEFLLVLGGARDGEVEPVREAFLADGGQLIVVQPTPRIVGASH